MRNGQRRTTGNDGTRGSAAMVAIATILPLLIAGGTMLSVVVRHRTEFEASIAKRAASDAAASGAQDALAKLQADPAYEGHYNLDFGGNGANVTVTEWDHDGIDNDGLNGVDDPAEAGFVSIRCDAWVNSITDGNGNRIDLPTRAYHSATDVILKKLNDDVVVNQAVYVDDPNADVDFNGNAFLISGNDTNLDGTAGPNPAIPGIGVPGDPAAIAAQIAKNQKADVQGSGGTPSVGTITAYDFVTRMDQLARASTLTFHGPDDDYSGALGDLSTLTPAIVHAKGNLKLSGSASGCGFLVVDGDLEIAGSFEFDGIVFVKGAVTFTGGGSKIVHGALMTLGAVEGTGLALDASVQLHYSSQAIANVVTKLAQSYVMVSWAQK